jgi:nucleoside-diphosphate-sugar epimerase
MANVVQQGYELMTGETKIILVAGGAGFIDSNLCQYLTKQIINVLLLDNFNEFYSEKIKFNNINSLLIENWFE